MAFRLLAEMRIALFNKLDQLAPAYLLRRRTGDLTAMATQDVEKIEFFFAHTVAPAFVAVLVPGIVVAALVVYGWTMALALLPFLALTALSPFFMRGRIDRLGSRAREALAELNAHAVDTIQGLAEIVAFQQAGRRGADFVERIRTCQRLRLSFYSDLTAQTSILEVATLDVEGGEILDFRLDVVDRAGNITTWPEQLSATAQQSTFTCRGDECLCCLLENQIFTSCSQLPGFGGLCSLF